MPVCQYASMTTIVVNCWQSLTIVDNSIPYSTQYYRISVSIIISISTTRHLSPHPSSIHHHPSPINHPYLPPFPPPSLSLLPTPLLHSLHSSPLPPDQSHASPRTSITLSASPPPLLLPFPPSCTSHPLSWRYLGTPLGTLPDNHFPSVYPQLSPITSEGATGLTRGMTGDCHYSTTTLLWTLVNLFYFLLSTFYFYSSK